MARYELLLKFLIIIHICYQFYENIIQAPHTEFKIKNKKKEREK